jgi:hypothetical protein
MGKGCRGGRKWDEVGRGEVEGREGEEGGGEGEGYAKKDKHEPLLTRVKVNANFDLLLYMTMDLKRCECEGVTRVLVLSCHNLKKRPNPGIYVMS